MIRIRDARFVAATRELGRYPDLRDPAGGRVAEIAFAGRSNVGKSYLINMLAGRRGLARTGSTPGRTRQLNFFAVDTLEGSVMLVDLPGYGYARAAKTEQATWGPLVESYLSERPTLRGVMLVVDVRRGIETEERALLDYLRGHGLSAVVVATKIDKLRHGQRRVALDAVAGSLSDTGAPVVVAVSAATRAGREDLWQVMVRPPLAVFEGNRGAVTLGRRPAGGGGGRLVG